MPTIYQDRCGISLYDAQFEDDTKVPIPSTVIEEVVTALLRFKSTCEDFGVPSHRMKIVATEATRTALNSGQFLERIKHEIGIEVEMLSKEEEGRLGALGIASSFQHTEGLVIDLGGGSVQLSWLESADGEVKFHSNGSVSLPYGAAALTKKLAKAKSKEEKDQLEQEVTTEVSRALETLEVVNVQKQEDTNENFHIFLSGGGFRGWGYILMFKHAVQPYPIPIINGFGVDTKDFRPSNISQLSQVNNSIFGISSRRASQVPAVSFLISALTTALPSWLERSRIYFAQGGLREGLLFSLLSPSIRASSPLVAATSPYAPPSALTLVSLLRSAWPTLTSAAPEKTSQPPAALLGSAVNLTYLHASCPKDIRASSALRCTTTGVLANAHGITHEERATLGLILLERWRGDLPSTDTQFHSGLQQIVGSEVSFWAAYAGRVLHGLGDVFPAGKVRDGTLAISSTWTTSEEGKAQSLRLEVIADESVMGTVERWAADLEKLGKKKHWVSGMDGQGPCGFKIQCTVTGRVS